MIDGPPNQAIDRHRRIHANLPGTKLFHTPASRSNHQPAYAAVPYQHVGPAAQNCHAYPSAMGQSKGVEHLICVAGFEQPLGGPADFERGDRRQWRAQPDTRAESFDERFCEVHAASP